MNTNGRNNTRSSGSPQDNRQNTVQEYRLKTIENKIKNDRRVSYSEIKNEINNATKSNVVSVVRSLNRICENKTRTQRQFPLGRHSERFAQTSREHKIMIRDLTVYMVSERLGLEGERKSVGDFGLSSN